MCDGEQNGDGQSWAHIDLLVEGVPALRRADTIDRREHAIKRRDAGLPAVPRDAVECRLSPLRRRRYNCRPPCRKTGWIRGRRSRRYLNRDVTTVQRWEKREGMPVHRHLHDRMGSVYAFRTELEAWAAGRHPNPRPEARRPRRHSRRRAPRSDLRLIGVVLQTRGGGPLTIGAGMWLRAIEFFWQSPHRRRAFQRVTDFDGIEQAAAVSRDGRFVAFLSDRDGPMDVWVTQIGSGQFQNLTRGGAPELVNPSVRMLGLLAGRLVRHVLGRTAGRLEQPGRSASGRCRHSAASRGRSSKASPSPTARRTARGSCTTRLGRATRCSSRMPAGKSEGRRIFTAPAGLHAHFPLWSPDGRFIYFVLGVAAGQAGHLAHPRRGADPPSGSRRTKGE